MGDRHVAPLDAVIVGAGAAGVGAGRVLQTAGASFVVLEARDRLGGRAHSVPSPGRPHGEPSLDLGAQWLHSADKNPLVPLAKDLDFAIDDCEPRWGTHHGRGMSAADQQEFSQQAQNFWRDVEQAADGPDQPAANLLSPGGRWNALLQAISCYYSGVELEQVSTRDLGNYEETRVNWSLFRGVGTFIAALGAALPVAFGQKVKKIDFSGPAVVIETRKGVLRAKTVIVTIPSNLLALEHIVFAPALPEKLMAAAQTPLGLANKIFFRLLEEDCRELPTDGHAFGALDRAEIISFDIRPRGEALVAGFVGGDFAKFLEEAAPDAFEAEARAQFGAQFGFELANRLEYLAASAWGRDPFASGSYSYARVGAGQAREILAAPVDDKVFFAGEACSRHRFSTVHGAYETGERAARQALAALQKTDVII